MRTKENPSQKQTPQKIKIIISYVSLSLFSAFNVCFFTPMDVFLVNGNEIPFPIKPLSYLMLAVTAAVFVVLLLCCIFIKGRANSIFRSIIFGVSLAFYVQGNFLAVNMGELNGSQYEIPVWKAVLNILIWLVVLALPFFLSLKFPESFDGTILFVSAALVVTQFVSLNYTYRHVRKEWGTLNTLTILFGDSRPMYTTDDLDVYGKNKNLIIILADEYDSFCFDNAIKEEPDSVSEFDGFVYYTNTVGTYHWTEASVAYMTTGNLGDDPTASDLINAYDNLEFFETVSARFKTNFYSDTTLPPFDTISKYSDNLKYEHVMLSDTCLYSRSIYRLAFFRCMPEVLKPLFWSSGTDIGKDIDLSHTDNAYDFDILNFYSLMPRELTATDEDVFKFIYLFGLHAPRNVTRDLERASKNNISPDEQAIAVNKIVNEYLKILKENGMYDNSEILFLADHGLIGHEDKKYPLLMYKPAHQTETGIKVSNAPISHDDLYPTLIKLSGGEPQARTIFDIAEDEQRVRHYVWTNEDITGNIKEIDN